MLKPQCCAHFLVKLLADTNERVVNFLSFALLFSRFDKVYMFL